MIIRLVAVVALGVPVVVRMAINRAMALGQKIHGAMVQTSHRGVQAPLAKAAIWMNWLNALKIA
jgi:hypothetical protein